MPSPRGPRPLFGSARPQRKVMAIRPIVEYPTAVLLNPGDPVVNFDGDLETLVQDMFDTMYDAEGVGLAAQQIGVPLRLFVMDCAGIKLVAANPEILSVEGEQGGEEGCLSVAKVPSELKRPDKAVLRAQDVSGEVFEKEATGSGGPLFPARNRSLRRHFIHPPFESAATRSRRQAF